MRRRNASELLKRFPGFQEGGKQGFGVGLLGIGCGLVGGWGATCGCEEGCDQVLSVNYVYET